MLQLGYQTAVPHSIKSFGYIKENCPHLTPFLAGLRNFVNNIYTVQVALQWDPLDENYLFKTYKRNQSY